MVSITALEEKPMDNVRFWNKMSAGYDAQAGGKYAKAYADTVTITRQYLKPTDLYWILRAEPALSPLS